LSFCRTQRARNISYWTVASYHFAFYIT
jgi:hypothetical protein